MRGWWEEVVNGHLRIEKMLSIFAFTFLNCAARTRIIVSLN